LWFTERAVDRIGRISTTGKITEYQLASGRLPLDITPARDGSLWFTDRAANCVGRTTVTGPITEFVVPTPGSDPLGITAGPDGTFWFMEGKGDRIARLNPQRRGGSPCQTSAPGPTGGPGY
jgi:virginiamycin B lyase